MRKRIWLAAITIPILAATALLVPQEQRHGIDFIKTYAVDGAGGECWSALGGGNYTHTQVNLLGGVSSSRVYNLFKSEGWTLWGQVPVHELPDASAYYLVCTRCGENHMALYSQEQNYISQIRPATKRQTLRLRLEDLLHLPQSRCNP